MFEKVIRILFYEAEKMKVFNQDISELQKAIKVLRDGTGCVVPLGKAGDGQVTTIKFDEL